MNGSARDPAAAFQLQLESQTVADAHEAAAQQISERFKHGDFDRLLAFKRKLVAEKASIDAQLKTAVQTQVDDAVRALALLSTTRDDMDAIGRNLETVDRLSNDAQTMVQNYPKIKKISRTHRNFLSTKEHMEQFQSLNERVARVSALLTEQRRDLLGPAEHLLPIHYEIVHLEAFRNSTMERSKRSSADVILTLQQYFRRLDYVVAEFADYLWDLAHHVLDLVQAKQPSVVVRLAKIIEAEERLDEMIGHAQPSDPAVLPSPDHVSTVGRTPKGYLSRFKEILQETVAARFQEAIAPFSRDLLGTLDHMDFVVDDLTVVYDDVAPLFPRRWGIFPFFVLRYHIHVYDLLNRIVANYLDAGSILRLLKWVRDYYDDMRVRLGVSEEVLMPELLDGKEQQLVNDYLKLIRTKLDEWMGNLFVTEMRQFCAREEPPEENNGIYGTASPVIMFQMVNQQIDIAAATGRDRLLYDVVSECCRSLEEFQTKWLGVLDAEFQKLLTKPAESPKGFPEYVMALANDCYRATEFTEVIVKKLDPFAGEEYRAEMNQSLGSTQDGFMRVAKRAYTVLVEVALNDTKPAVGQLHCQQWYSEDLMRLVLGTLEDYCNDFQAHMQEYLFTKLFAELLDRFVIMYLDAFRNKSARYKAGLCADRLKRDLADAEAFFTKYRNEKRVKGAFEAVDKIVSVLLSQPGLLFLDAYAAWKAYPDMPGAYLEDVLSKRDDLDKNQVAEVMSDLRSKMSGQRVNLGDPSYFGRLGR
ncbi:exocyst complex component Sec6-domain-containing protein [Hyaloraphidium curvatum]|nr:exocyst complex component Sec6-domain-containing protein [Hyaloraphidium curvatum]